MKIAFLGSVNSWYYRDLVRAGGDEYAIELVAFSRLAAGISQHQETIYSGDQTLHPFDAVLVRSMPAGSLEQVVFRMNALARLEAAGKLVINPAKSLEIAIDKHLALARLRDVKLPVPQTHVCQNVNDAMQAFEQLGGDIVIKPIFGGEGRGLTRISDEALALRAFQMLSQNGAVLYLQRFYPHRGYDIRLLVIGDEVLGMRRRNDHDWRTNVSHGAETESVEVNDHQRETAIRASTAVGAPLVAVDLLPTQAGQTMILEVNAVPGWRALARTLKLDVSRKVLNWMRLQQLTPARSWL